MSDFENQQLKIIAEQLAKLTMIVGPMAGDIQQIRKILQSKEQKKMSPSQPEEPR